MRIIIIREFRKRKKGVRSKQEEEEEEGVAEIPIADFCQWQGNLWFAIYFEYG